MLVYHTFFAEFSGADAQAVLDAVYAHSRKGTGFSYDEWWAYQQKLWQSRYGRKIPEASHPDAAGRLLQVLIDVGALVEGPRPAKAATS